MCECLFRCVCVCVCVCCAYRSQPGRQLAIYDLLASLFGFGWCVIAAIGCFGLPPAPPPLTHTHTIHPCWLCAAQSVVVSFFIFHFNLNLFEIRERDSEKMLKFLFWPLPTSQRLNKQRQTSNNNNTYIGQEHVEEQEQQRASLFYYSSPLDHLSCCCCFNTWQRRQRVELELIFFEFLLLRCHFPRSRLCVGVTYVCVCLCGICFWTAPTTTNSSFNSFDYTRYFVVAFRWPLLHTVLF